MAQARDVPARTHRARRPRPPGMASASRCGPTQGLKAVHCLAFGACDNHQDRTCLGDGFQHVDDSLRRSPKHLVRRGSDARDPHETAPLLHCKRAHMSPADPQSSQYPHTPPARDIRQHLCLQASLDAQTRNHWPLHCPATQADEGEPLVGIFLLPGIMCMRGCLGSHLSDVTSQHWTDVGVPMLTVRYEVCERHG